MQWDFFKEANTRILTEKAIFRRILHHEIFPKRESLILNGQEVTIDYDDTILVSICEGFCYKIFIEYDFDSRLILNITYE